MAKKPTGEVKRSPLLQMIYDMVNSTISDKSLAKRMGLPLKLIQRYRLAVDRFYNGAEKEPQVKWRKR